MQYQELEPRAELRPYVRLIWRLRSQAPRSDTESIVPDGCAEIILNRGDVFRRFADDGSSHAQDEVLLVGQLRRPLRIEPTGVVDLFGVRFEPAGLFGLLGAPMHELTEADMSVGAVAPGLHRRLREAGRLRDEGEFVRAVEASLLDQLAARRARPGLASVAVTHIAHGARSAEALSRTLGIHRRGLERLFRTEVGLSPKLLIRIQRVQGVLAQLDAGGRAPGWAAVAARHGFSDQSHLIRDFHLLVGTTPRRYLRERTELAGHFEQPGLSHSSNP